MSAAVPGDPAVAERPLRLAHRGDWRRAPENSLEAMVAAVVIAGCDGVEFDVRLSRDGVPVLLHDETLARVQGRPVRVDALTAAELARYGIPELEAVLRALPREAFVYVELKGDDHGDATADVLRAGRGEAPKLALVASFEGAAVAAMADRLPGWRRWLIAPDLEPATISLALGLGCHGISAMWTAINPSTMRAAAGAGLDVAAWTIRRRATFDRLARLGVVAACVEGAALVGDAGAQPSVPRCPR